MGIVETELPRWDLTPAFPAIASPEFDSAFDDLVAKISGLVGQFDQLSSEIGAGLSDSAIAVFDRFFSAYNDILEHSEVLEAFLYGYFSTDSNDELAQSKLSEYEQQTLPLQTLRPKLVALLGRVDLAQLLEKSETARDHEFLLRRAQVMSEHLMSEAEEVLAAELSLSGGSAWAKLYSNVASQIEVPFEKDGEVQQLPMSAIRNFAIDLDRDIRRRAYDAELVAWKKNAVPIAAALNGIKGESNTLNDQRGWKDPLDLATFQNHIDRETLDAMMSAARDSFPAFRRYMQAKGRLFGTEGLAWYDLFAPVGESVREWSYQESLDFIAEKFGEFSPRMKALAVRSFERNWIDADARPGKQGGAFCMPFVGDESRILMNFTPGYSAMSTLAHELGHAYHSHVQYGRTPLQRMDASTLAETASTFCETIVFEAALERSTPAESFGILEQLLQDATQIVVDISSRYLFEQTAFEARREHDVSVEEFCQFMRDAQEQTYGDGLNANLRHEYMWAAKSHYYGPVFYNFPYMFGQLFALGLYSRYREEPASFIAGYDDLLSSTGMADAATLANRFGIDVRGRDFWEKSLGVLTANIDKFVELADARVAARN